MLGVAALATLTTHLVPVHCPSGSSLGNDSSKGIAGQSDLVNNPNVTWGKGGVMWFCLSTSYTSWLLSPTPEGFRAVKVAVAQVGSALFDTQATLVRVERLCRAAASTWTRRHHVCLWRSALGFVIVDESVAAGHSYGAVGLEHSEDIAAHH